ncbi:MAG: FAD-dependent oxidoreductase [Acidobacteria bacterium]|nr:FAD-dependent oxidoreductase [Acidobacteriota bacterium]
MAPARVAILGGGLAGMAAALRLAETGYAVELIEKRTVLGGRASSFIPPGETAPIDNCQHVLLGCCTNLIDFFRRTSTANQFRYYSRFLFQSNGAIASLSASALPAPFHFLPSLAGFRALRWQDRWAIARAMLAILRTPQPVSDEPLVAWLDRQGQSAAVKENFWRVILVSALNEDLERLSTRAAFQVFRDGFLRNRRGYRMGVPKIPLGELYSSRLLGEKCALALGIPVAEIETGCGRVQCVRMQNGELKTADYYISALPSDALGSLLSGEQRRQWPGSTGWVALEWSPITGIHLWFDRRVMELEHLTVCGRTIQWIFNKSALSGNSDANEGTQYIQLVVSASRQLVMMKRGEILELALHELGKILPRTKQATVRKAVVVKETKATFSFSPGTDDLRPGAETPFANLYLAGDWTQTGWPPTMEGAVRSGYRAAERVTEAAGNPQQFLVPDLASDPLASLLLRS